MILLARDDQVAVGQHRAHDDGDRAADGRHRGRQAGQQPVAQRAERNGRQGVTYPLQEDMIVADAQTGRTWCVGQERRLGPGQVGGERSRWTTRGVRDRRGLAAPAEDIVIQLVLCRHRLAGDARLTGAQGTESGRPISAADAAMFAACTSR